MCAMKKFDDVLSKATAVFGSRSEAENWMRQPATGLNQRRPVDMMATVDDIRLVEEFLDRIERGVY